MDITQKQNNYDKDSKQVPPKRIYEHKKFGTCPSSTTPTKTVAQKTNNELPKDTAAAKTSCPPHIFRPYALPDAKTRESKPLVYSSKLNEKEFEIENKIFTSTSNPMFINPTSSASLQATQPIYPQPVIPIYHPYYLHPGHLTFNPDYRFLPPHEFDKSIYSIMLLKQSVAVSLGEIIKSQEFKNSSSLKD